MATERQRLALRGAGASFAANLVAAVSHTIGGEPAPAPLIVVGMMALLWAPAMLLMGRRPRAGRIAATVIVAQAAFHSIYAALGFPSGTVTHAAHAHGAHVHLLPAAGAGVEVSPLMIAAHVVAAVVTFAVLVYGERTIEAVRAWTAASVRARIAAPRPPLAPAPVAAAHAAIPAAAWRAFALISPRGPPLPSL